MIRSLIVASCVFLGWTLLWMAAAYNYGQNKGYERALHVPGGAMVCAVDGKCYICEGYTGKLPDWNGEKK